MNPISMAAVTPFRFMDLPQEIRDDIYEAAIFDFTPPELVYWEALDVIVRRAQLVMVSVPRVRHAIPDEFFMRQIAVRCGITVIRPKYRSFCIINHQIIARRTTGRPDANSSMNDWRCLGILHQRDIKPFCHAIMGKFDTQVENGFGPESIHTLILRCPPTYAQRESMSIYETQTRILQEYRNMLHGFSDVSIHGAGIGWETGLYAAVLQDIRSTKDMPEFVDDIRDWEQDGTEILQQTGDFEAANASWVKAIRICDIARITFCLSDESFPTDISRGFLESNVYRLYIERWTLLRRRCGAECVFLILELHYKLITNQLSGILRLIQKGGHLARSRGRTPLSIRCCVFFVGSCYHESNFIAKCHTEPTYLAEYFPNDGWSPRPFEEAQLRFTVATIFRLLDASMNAATAWEAICRAAELAPDDESIQQEREKVKTWITRLVEDAKLESFPESWTFERRAL